MAEPRKKIPPHLYSFLTKLPAKERRSLKWYLERAGKYFRGEIPGTSIGVAKGTAKETARLAKIPGQLLKGEKKDFSLRDAMEFAMMSLMGKPSPGGAATVGITKGLAPKGLRASKGGFLMPIVPTERIVEQTLKHLPQSALDPIDLIRWKQLMPELFGQFRKGITPYESRLLRGAGIPGRGRGVIGIDPMIPPKEAMDTLLHELVHARQRGRGLTKGATGRENFMNTLAAVMTAEAKHLAEQKGGRIYTSLPTETHARGAAFQLEGAMRRPGKWVESSERVRGVPTVFLPQGPLKQLSKQEYSDIYRKTLRKALSEAAMKAPKQFTQAMGKTGGLKAMLLRGGR